MGCVNKKKKWIIDMNKRIKRSICFACMSCSLALANFMPVWANEEDEQIEEEAPVIETAQDFIDLFCKVEIITFDEEQEISEELPEEQEVEKELIFSIDSSNVDLILASESVYASFDEEMQAQIEESFHQAYVDYISSISPEVSLEEIESQLPFASYADLLEQAKEFEQTLLAQQEQEDTQDQENNDGIDCGDNFNDGLDEGFSVDSEIPATLEDAFLIQQTSLFQTTPVQTPQAAAGVGQAQVETPQTQIETAQPQVEIPEAQIETPQAQVENPVQEQTGTEQQNQIQVQSELETTAQQQVQSEQQASTQTEQKIETNTQNETSSTLSTSAASFIATYVSDSQGIYTQVSNANYKQILSGLGAWNDLSSETRAMINNRLSAAGSSSYQSLLRYAQQIQSGTLNTETSSNQSNQASTAANLIQNQMPSVNTATSNHAIRYTALFGASLAALYGILKTYMKQ
jgi:outer membrane biosynthesis protein TonB